MDAESLALDYLKRGWSVVPILPAEKRPVCEWKPYQSRKPDESEVLKWYGQRPDAGVGIVCGDVSGGLVVLDVDPRNGGDASMKDRPLPTTPRVRTGGGGWHYFFQAAGVRKKTGLLPGVDLQAEGSFVVAPPSLHASGKRYEWDEGLSPDEVEIAPLPEWVQELAASSRQPTAAERTEGAAENCLAAREGARHDSMVKLVGRWLAQGMSGEEARRLAREANAKYAPPLSERELDSIVESLSKKEAAKDKAPRQKAARYVGDFDGLAEIVLAQDRTAFLVKKPDGSPAVVSEHLGADGKPQFPPPPEKLPWRLPRADEALRHVAEASSIGAEAADRALFRDLTDYHRRISELPGDDYYALLAAYDMHTYLLENFQYSPILLLYSVPERGKTRTGKGILHVVRRGLHVESLRDSYIIRAAGDMSATLFFDVRAFWKKAEQAGSDDVILLRFERGGRAPRVLYPDRGAFADTVFYPVFGPTVIASNEPLHHILETRAIAIQMPDSSRPFEAEVKPETALALKERLVAFRFRHLGGVLPSADKPAAGRLGDIMRPLIQTVRLAAPEEEPRLLSLTRAFENARRLEKSESYEAELIGAVWDCRSQVENGVLALHEIVGRFNADREERLRWAPQRVSKVLAALGFARCKVSGGKAAVHFDETLLTRLRASYGLCTSPSSPTAETAGLGEVGEVISRGTP